MIKPHGDSRPRGLEQLESRVESQFLSARLAKFSERKKYINMVEVEVAVNVGLQLSFFINFLNKQGNAILLSSRVEWSDQSAEKKTFANGCPPHNIFHAWHKTKLR